MSTATVPPANPSLPAVSLQRLAAVMLVVLEAAVVAHPSRGWFFGSGLMALALGSILFASRNMLVTGSPFWHLIGVIVLFALKYSVSPHAFPMDAAYISSEMSHEIANGLIAIQICLLYQARHARRLPASFVILGGIAVVFGCNARVYGLSRGLTTLALTLAFLLGVALFSMTSRRPLAGRFSAWRIALLTAVVGAYAVAATGSSLLLRKYERDLESMVLNYLAGIEGNSSSRAGYSGLGTLSQIGDWKTHDDDRIRVRVTSDTPPGYLRGSVWDTYTPYMGTWTSTRKTEVLGTGAPRNAPRPNFAGNFFRLADVRSEVWRTMEFRIDRDNVAATFLPMDAAYVFINEPNLTVDSNRMILRRNTSREPYAALVPLEFQREILSEAERKAALSPEVELDPRIRRLADELFADCRTARDKMNAVTAHFTRNYQYKLGIDIPPNEDPVTFFLTNRIPAHCEYFASGSALLLKLGGVPARYATGYVAAERNDLGDAWLARSKDAHAWVEAYDDVSQRWEIVESTPGTGVPAYRASDLTAELSGGLWQMLSRLEELLKQDGLWGAIGHAARQPFVQVVLAGLLILAALQYRRAALAIGSRPARERPERDLREWHRQLDRMDRRMRRAGRPRVVGETPGHFAERLRGFPDANDLAQAATWYEDYARARYSPETTAPPAELRDIPVVPRMHKRPRETPVS